MDSVSKNVIDIFHIKKHVACQYDHYVGRPTALGNPFTHIKNKKTLAKFIVVTRDEAIAKYKEYAKESYISNTKFKKELDALVNLYKNGQNIHLLCWCSPADCHARILKEMIIELSESKTVNE